MRARRWLLRHSPLLLCGLCSGTGYAAESTSDGAMDPAFLEFLALVVEDEEGLLDPLDFTDLPMAEGPSQSTSAQGIETEGGPTRESP